jgi:ribose transport system substrate-binding protein
VRSITTFWAVLIGALMLAGASAAAADEAALAGARALVDEHLKIPNFSAPLPAFDAAACMKGKKILSIPVSSTIPFVQGTENAMADTAKHVGFTVEHWKNQGNPTQWAQGVEHAISGKFDAIDLWGGILPSALGPQVAAAHAAGLKVFAASYSDTTQKGDPAADVSLAQPYSKAGEIIAAWIAVKTQGKANVLIVGSDDIQQSRPYAKSIADSLDKYCSGGCKHSYASVTIPDWASKIQPTVQSALIADPTINYVVPLYDSMAQFVVPALTITGRKDNVKIATFNGTPFVIDLVRRGDVEMDVGESLSWLAEATLDGYMRGLCGQSAGDVLNIPLRIFDAENAKEAGEPAEFNKGYGDADVEGFRKLWGLR